jgi:hypothetical protein
MSTNQFKVFCFHHTSESAIGYECTVSIGGSTFMQSVLHLVLRKRQNTRKDIFCFECKTAALVFSRNFAPALTDTKLMCSATITLPYICCEYTFLFSYFTLQLYICLKLTSTDNFKYEVFTAMKMWILVF